MHEFREILSLLFIMNFENDYLKKSNQIMCEVATTNFVNQDFEQL